SPRRTVPKPQCPIFSKQNRDLATAPCRARPELRDAIDRIWRLIQRFRWAVPILQRFRWAVPTLQLLQDRAARPSLMCTKRKVKRKRMPLMPKPGAVICALSNPMVGAAQVVVGWAPPTGTDCVRHHHLLIVKGTSHDPDQDARRDRMLARRCRGVES